MPKRWCASRSNTSGDDPVFAGEASIRLLDIHATKVSPELKPTHDGKVTQLTDNINGPEEVRDFFMRYFRRFGDTPEKIMYLIQQAVGFQRQYTQDELNAWWQRFATRVFASVTRTLAASTVFKSARTACRRMATGWYRAMDRRPSGSCRLDSTSRRSLVDIDRQVKESASAAA